MARPPISGVRPLNAGQVDLDAVILKGQGHPGVSRTVHCRTVATGRLRQLNYIRDLPPQTVSEEEPDNLLQDSLAPNASEALLAALGSCLAVGIRANAIVQGIPIRTLELNLEAELNASAAWGTGDLSPKALGFESIRVSVHLEADVPRERLEILIRHALLWSPVANTLHNPVHLEVALA